MHRLFFIWGCLLLGLVVFEFGCDPKNKVETCQLSVDCSRGKVCKKNICVDCSADSECQNRTFICIKGSCRIGCRKDANCQNGETCRNNLCLGGCGSDSECSANERCANRKCVTKCVTRADCKEPLYCRSSTGFCVTCLRDEHCQNGYLCSDKGCTCPKERECSRGICSDLQTDPNNCSLCGVRCLHGACAGGICQFVASTLYLGGTNSCAKAKTGEFRCWGSNQQGALGDGSSDGTKAPIIIKAFASASALSMQGDSVRGSGYASTCGIFNGLIKCWGANDFGQLGNGLNISSSEPVQVKGLRGVLAVSSGKATWHKGKGAGYHRCALLQEQGGIVKCWGSNAFGELGDGTFNMSTIPVSVIGLKNVTQLAAGGGHTCALLRDGTIECWGNNEFGQLGKGDTSPTAGPIDVRGLRNVISVTSGVFHSCALLDSGKVWCWGRNENGQVGNPNRKNQLVPFEVPTVKDIVMIAAGSSHTCALGRRGKLWCWGRNLFGALGVGSLIDQVLPPTVIKLPPVEQLAIGESHSCVILQTDKTIRCWGLGDSGQLGNRKAETTGLPSRVVEE